jgi:hypothetical protein
MQQIPKYNSSDDRVSLFPCDCKARAVGLLLTQETTDNRPSYGEAS